MTRTILFSVLGLCLVGCPSSVDNRDVVSAPLAAPQAAPQTDAAIPTTLGGVDFANFTYRVPERRRHIKLVNGAEPVPEEPWSLSSLQAADVTGDGTAEAIVTLYMHTLGTASFFRVFIYDVSDEGRPRQLWSFWCGDRADGGLRRVQEQDGHLVVELFGAQATPERPSATWEAGVPDGACCPTRYTRTKYRWARDRFVRLGAPEVFDNPGHSLAPGQDENLGMSATRRPN